MTTPMLVQLTAAQLRDLVRDAVRVELAAHRVPRVERAEVADTPVTEEHRRKAERIMTRPRRVRRST